MKPILTFLFVLLLVCPGFSKDNQPNVVILLADDLGTQDLGCYGGPVKTPVLDSLAARGVQVHRLSRRGGSLLAITGDPPYREAESPHRHLRRPAGSLAQHAST